MNISENIKQVRETLGYNQGEFAKKLNLNRNSISLFENGKRNASDRTIHDICNTFGISEEYLRTGKGEMFDTALQQKIEQNEKVLKILDANLSMKEMDLLLELIKQMRKE